MTDHPAAPILAERLGRLQHTNNRGEIGTVALPGFSTVGMTTDQAQATGTLALAVAEAVIETLETSGYRVLSDDQIKARTAPKPVAEEVTLICNRCRQPVVKVSTAGQAKINVKTMLVGLSGHEC